MTSNTTIIFKNSLLQDSIKEYGSQVLKDMASEAHNNLVKLDVPTLFDDEWRFIDLASLVQYEFINSSKELIAPEDIEQIKKRFLPDSIRIVLVNGCFSSELSALSGLNKNLQISVNMDHCIHEDGRSKFEDSNIEKYHSDLYPKSIMKPNFFTTLNQSFFSEELFLNVIGEMDEKIHLLNISLTNETNGVSYPRIKLVVNKNCSATVIEDYMSFDNEISLTNVVTEIVVKEDAKLNHNILQSLTKTAFYLGNSSVTVMKNGTYDGNLVINGARLSKCDINIALNDIHATANLNGLTLIRERQISDVRTVIHHNSPDCRSDQIHKSIADGSAHSIFNGKIFVGGDSARTEAHQQNRSLMLSKKARITTEPKLEINNDDVVCTHGATVSQMDENILFFLKSRGINETDAIRLCVNAFAHEIIGKIPVIEIQNSLLTGV